MSARQPLVRPRSIVIAGLAMQVLGVYARFADQGLLGNRVTAASMKFELERNMRGATDGFVQGDRR